MTPIHIMALRHSAFYSPLLLTISGGYLQNEGLEPTYTVASHDNPVPQALREGRAHLSQSAVATSFAELEQGKTCDIVHFAQINERDGFFLAGRRPEPDFEWSQLVGKQVLVDHFFQPLAMFRYALHVKGVAEAELDMIDAGDVAAINAAFRAGRGDYVHQQGPAPQQLEHDGLGYVVASVGEAIGPVAFSSVCATRDWLQTGMAQAFMRAYRRACQDVLILPAAEIAHREAAFFPDIAPAVLCDTIRSYQQLGCWSPDPIIRETAYTRLLDVFLYNDIIHRRHPMSACVVAPPGD